MRPAPAVPSTHMLKATTSAPTPRGSYRTILIWAGTAVVAGALVSSGCKGPPASPTLERPAPGNNESPPAPAVAVPVPLANSAKAAAADVSTPNQPMVALTRVDFEIVHVRLPGNLFTESGRIWDHLDEEAIQAETILHLRSNGLRVARGKRNAWPSIKTIIETVENVQASQTAMRVVGAPLILQLTHEPRDQDVFLFRNQGPVRMPGATFPQSINYLHVEHQLPTDKGGSLILQLVPEFRLAPRAAPPKLTSEGWTPPQTEEPGRVLWELACRLPVGPDEFVAIGPSPATRRVSGLVGSLFFCETKDGVRLESMYFITPTIVGSDQASSLMKTPQDARP